MLGSSSSIPDPFRTPLVGGAQGQTQKWADRNYRFDGKIRVSTPDTIVDLQSNRTVVLIGLVSQSNQGNHLFGSYSILNPTKIYNFSIDNGAFYQTAVPLLGCTFDSATVQENYLPRLADKLIASGKCDRVVLVPVAVGGTTVQDWGPGGPLHALISVALLRCKANNLLNGGRILVLSHIGESDKIAGTSQAEYTSRATACYNAIKNIPGFSGKIFITQTSFISGATSTAIRAAQAALVDNSSIYLLGDTDAFTGATYRDDLLHFNQAGADAITSVFATNIGAYLDSL